MLTLSVRQPDWQKAIQDLVLPIEEKIGLVMQAIGTETIAYLKSLTEERRPPARTGGGERTAHPGHWADVTGQLVNSYAFEVTKAKGGWRLTFANTAEYAIYLELRDGFFVLSGIMDLGGIVQQTIAEVIANIAPDWSASFSTLQFGHPSESA